jgi:DNA repair protein RadA/Sms
MARAQTTFTCTSCGQASLRWMGRCPGCGEWNTLVETAGDPQADRRVPGGKGPSAARRPRGAGTAEPRKPVALADVERGETQRLQTGSEEFDRVLGGGLVPGSVVLLGGSPGIGKSTLMSAALARIQATGRSTLYVSGEESAAQVRLRAERLGPHALDVPILAETSLDVVLASLEQ